MELKWDYYGVVAKDLETSVRFYRMLGIPLPEPEGDHVEVALTNGMRFALDSLELIKQLGHWEEPVGHRAGIGINAGSAANVDSVYQMVIEAGFVGRTPPWDAFWGQRYSQVEDPDGNVVDIFAWL